MGNNRVVNQVRGNRTAAFPATPFLAGWGFLFEAIGCGHFETRTLNKTIEKVVEYLQISMSLLFV